MKVLLLILVLLYLLVFGNWVMKRVDQFFKDFRNEKQEKKRVD